MSTDPQHHRSPFPSASGAHAATEQSGGATAPGISGDLRTLLGAALLTFAGGMVVLLGYMMIGGFGAFVGLFGAGFGIMWLAGVHGGRVFPREGFPPKSLVGAALVGAVLLALAAAMS